MSSTLPILLLAAAVAVIVVGAMPWHRPHPNHVFLLELLKIHLQERPELKDGPAEARNSRDRSAAA